MTTDQVVLLALALAAMVVGAGVWLFAVGRSPVRETTRGVAPVPCAYRRGEPEPWARGTLCYTGNRVDHYGRGGFSPPLLHRWRRGTLDLRQARTVPVAAVPLPAGPTGAVVVDCTDGDHDFELALGSDHYTALRAWLEAVPPGWNANRA